MAIDDATRALLDGLATQGRPPMHESTPEEIRAGSPRTTAMLGPGPEMRSTRLYVIESADGGRFPVRVLVPSGSPRATVLYFHGGGWVLGDLDGFDTLGRSLAAAADVTVVLVGYRLAPEHPFPTPVEDAWAALQWVRNQAGRVDGVEGPFVVAGDSAGANLAIVSALRARSEGPEIAASLLMYPVTDSDVERASYLDPQNQLLIGKAEMEWFLGHYLGDRDRRHPDVAPLRVADLSGFPPTALALAEHDPLRDEGEAFGQRLEAAGVPVEQRLFEGQMHGFFQMINLLPASREAVDWFAGRLERTLLRSGADA